MSSPPRPLETQPARTALAWQRTGLSLLLVAGLLARGAAVHGRLLLVVPAAVVAGAGLVVLGVLGSHRARASAAAARSGGDGRAPGTAALATGLVVLTALCALAAELALRT
ncbi:MAG: putative rane protein [Modestobacter sp.]|jgi:hypothetical protein|nr:putative rane protein [Modestobacter sp.]